MESNTVGFTVDDGGNEDDKLERGDGTCPLTVTTNSNNEMGSII